MEKIQLIKRCSKPELDGMGLKFTPDQLFNCDVPVFKVLTWGHIVVLREGNWTEFPFKELQMKLGKGLDVASVNYIEPLHTTVIVFAAPDPIPQYEKILVTNGTGEDFGIDIWSCENLRPPFHKIFSGEI